MISKEECHSSYTFVTVSDIGSNHRALLMPNQDAAAFFCADEDFVLAVSDGVGSCKKSEIGSDSAVNSCVKVFKKIKNRIIAFEDESVAEELISVWRTSLEAEDIDDCCATLKAVIKIGDSIKAISIGDGFIVITSEGIHLLSPFEETSFTNETKCLSSYVNESDLWISDFHLDTYKPYAIMCCTDGVANGIQPGKEINLVEDIEKATSLEELKAELEELISDISNYCFDDKTVGVVKYERKN